MFSFTGSRSKWMHIWAFVLSGRTMLRTTCLIEWDSNNSLHRGWLRLRKVSTSFPQQLPFWLHLLAHNKSHTTQDKNFPCLSDLTQTGHANATVQYARPCTCESGAPQCGNSWVFNAFNLLGHTIKPNLTSRLHYVTHCWVQVVPILLCQCFHCISNWDRWFPELIHVYHGRNFKCLADLNQNFEEHLDPRLMVREVGLEITLYHKNGAGLVKLLIPELWTFHAFGRLHSCSILTTLHFILQVFIVDLHRVI